MHYLIAYRAHEREDQELAAFDLAIDTLSRDKFFRLEEIMQGLQGLQASRSAKYRAMAIACAQVGIVDRFAVRGIVRTFGMGTTSTHIA